MNIECLKMHKASKLKECILRISILDTKHYSHAKGYKLKLCVHKMKAYEITYVLVQKVILHIEELLDKKR